MKKFLAMLMTVAMSISILTFASAKDLSDIDNHQNEEAIEVLTDLGIITGYTDGTYRPDANITRGEVCAIITRALVGDKNCHVTYPDRFTDVSNMSGLRKYVDTAYRLGIMNGYGNGKFGLNDPVTYDQMAAILTRALGYDIGSVSGSWPLNVVTIAVNHNLFDNAVYAGSQSITRAHVAQMVYNTFDEYTVTSLGAGNFVSTNEKFITELGYEVKANEMSSDHMATFGDEVIIYEKDGKTYTTKLTLTNRLNNVAVDEKNGKLVIYHSDKNKEIVDNDNIDYYLNGADSDLDDVSYYKVDVIYKDNKPIRVIAWNETETKIGNMPNLDDFKEIFGDKYIRGESVVTLYGDFAIEVSNETVTGKITKKSVLKNGDIEIVIDGEEYLIPSDTADKSNAVINNYAEIKYDYNGNIFAINKLS